jgi:hypothetical protein
MPGLGAGRVGVSQWGAYNRGAYNKGAWTGKRLMSVMSWRVAIQVVAPFRRGHCPSPQSYSLPVRPSPEGLRALPSFGCAQDMLRHAEGQGQAFGSLRAGSAFAESGIAGGSRFCCFGRRPVLVCAVAVRRNGDCARYFSGETTGGRGDGTQERAGGQGCLCS